MANAESKITGLWKPVQNKVKENVHQDTQVNLVDAPYLWSFFDADLHFV